ncbi:MAG TPA: tyrosine--tRNA ligase, partial [Termitinemataceae bacterium]|nr:tyrosine--tRNA ligase [Termitinemataceae bacterium]
AAFGGGGDKSAMPSVELPRSRFEQGYNVVDLFCDAGLVPTKSEGRRLVQQGGAFVTRVGGPFQELETIGDVAALIGSDRITEEGELLLRAGKKRYCRVVIKG